MDYYFITADEFKDSINRHEFVEWEMVYAGKYYGTLKSELRRIWQLAQVPPIGCGCKRRHQYTGAIPQTIIIIIHRTPFHKELERRLKARGTETPESIKSRINKASYEMTFKDRFDHIIINDKLEIACKEAENSVREFLGLQS